MNDSRLWRRYITAWVAMLCLAAVACCWLLVNRDRYQFQHPEKMGFHSFDKSTGKMSQIGVEVLD